MALRSSVNLFRLLPSKCYNVCRTLATTSINNYCNTSSSAVNIFHNSGVRGLLQFNNNPVLVTPPARNYHLLQKIGDYKPNLLNPRELAPPFINEAVRNLVQWSLLKGKRKTVKAVIRRFYRLHWGIWIHARSGRHRKLWRKGTKQRKRARTHVFCNATQSFMLDKMVGKYWLRRKYYVDDPYEPYHTRPEFWITNRR